MIAAAVLAAGALVLPRARWRAVAMLAALAVALVVLAGDARGAVPWPGIGATVAAGGVVAIVLARRPALLPALAVAAVPWRVPMATDAGTVEALVGLQAVAIGAALAYALPRLRDDEPAGERPPGPLEWVVAAVVLAYAVQALGAADAHRALTDVAAFHVPGAILFGLLARTAWTRRTAMEVLGVAVVLAAVMSGLAIAERATGRLLVSPEAVASLRSDTSLRPGSFFFDPDLFGRWLAIVLACLAAVIAWARRPRELIACALAAALLWAGLVTTLSRPSFVALLAGLAVVAALRWRARAVVAAGLAVVAVAAAAAVLTADGAADRRADQVSAAARAFADHPVAGRGSGTAVAAARIEPAAVAEEQGVPGLLLLVALVGVAGVTFLRGARGDPARAAAAGALAVVVVHSCAAGALLEDPSAWVVLGAGTALAPALRLSRSPARPRAAGRRSRRRASPARA
jgi:putative inorganic carbon (HCO3(-)) transporter